MHFLSCGGELNHHGRYMCDCMYRAMGDDFKRITTRTIDAERIHLGYKEDASVPYNVMGMDADAEKIREWIRWSDVVDYGAAPEEYLREAVRQDKIVFIRIERLLKEGAWKLFVPQVFFRYYRKYIKYRKNPNVYYLCVSAYAAADLAKIGIRGDRVLQWAYCPEFISMKPEAFDRKPERLQLLWCGRMIQWKHPEMAVHIARELKRMGCAFHLKMLGTGAKMQEVQALIDAHHLGQEVTLCGAVSAENVREYMMEADVFLATSDQNEGWGVVINEAMNSGCAVFATPQMGAAPILIREGENGYFIHEGREREAAAFIMELADNEERLRKIKRNAYETIRSQFSPEVYARRFMEIAKDAQMGAVADYECLGSKAIIR